MTKTDLLSVIEAKRRILAAAHPIRESESVPLKDALGRILAQDLVATLTHPPADVSAMDGYAVRTADFQTPDASAAIIGESSAGHGFAGDLQEGACVRIFTGAPIPKGADAILLQEDAQVKNGWLHATVPIVHGKHIREAGLDFHKGAIGLTAGARLGPAQLAFAAAMNYAKIPVMRKPRIAILANGDELVPPGSHLQPNQIISSNSILAQAMVVEAGGAPIDLGIAPDSIEALTAAIEEAIKAKADALVTLGGASVGDRDFVKTALADKGMRLNFWRIAMRPGKPLIHGAIGAMHVIGLPGNPVSAFVGATVFLTPLIRKLAGDPLAAEEETQTAQLGAHLPANSDRHDFIRATLARDTEGALVATPCALQDSSLLSVLAHASALILRPPRAPAAAQGDTVAIRRL